MMIDIDVHQLDGIVRAWLKDTLKTDDWFINRMFIDHKELAP